MKNIKTIKLDICFIFVFCSNVSKFCFGTEINSTYFDHVPTIFAPSNDIYTTDSDVYTKVMVPDASNFQCQTDRDCNDGLALTSDMQCREDNTCGCLNSCLIYTYTVYGFHAIFEFHCGRCGQLGSECENEDDCDYPGICSRKDHFCHCPIGEHKENVCIIFVTHFLGAMIAFAVCIFVVTILCACGYQCCIGYRMYGNWRWWQNIREWRIRRQAPPVTGPDKSPAFTTTMNMWNRDMQESVESSSEYSNLPSTSNGITHPNITPTISDSVLRRSDSMRSNDSDISLKNLKTYQNEIAVIDTNCICINSISHSKKLSIDNTYF